MMLTFPERECGMVLDVQSLHLACGLALALLLAQAAALSLAQALSSRLPWRIQVLGMCLPLALLLPLLAGHRVVAPTDAPILANLPDAPQVSGPDFSHGVFNDAILQLLPWEAEVRRGFAEGHLPLWSDLLDGGSSPWVNPQAAVLSPIAILGRLLPLEHFLLGTIAVKLLLAFEGCWLLARAFGAGRFSAMLGAAGFAFGGPVLAWAVFPLSSVVAWSPWLALAATRLARRPCARHVVAGTLVLAAVLLSGHPEIALAECVVAGGIAAIGSRWRAEGALVPFGASTLAALLGGSLAACQLLPFLLVAPHSLRAARGESPAALATASDIRIFPAGEARLFLGVLNPWTFGRPFHEPFSGPDNWPIAAGSYLGFVALAGVASALASARRRLVFSLLALALGTLLLTIGFYPFRWLLAMLPLGGSLAFDRFLPAVSLPLAILAAIGLDVLLLRRSLAGLAMMLVAACASLLIRHDPWLSWLWLLVASGFVLGLRGRRAQAGGVLCFAALLDLGSWGRDVLPRGHHELFYPRTPLIVAIESVAGAVGGPWRAVAGGFRIYPSLLPIYGVADVRIDNPMALTQQLRPLSEIFEFRPEGRRYKGAFHNLGHPLLDFLNVRAVALEESAAAPSRFELVRNGSPLRLYRNPSALPRFFLPITVDVRDRASALEGLREMRDARRVVITREDAGSWRALERPWDPAAVRILHSRAGWVSLLLPAMGQKLLATSLPFPDGWTATTEGRTLRSVVVNTAYFGAVVPSGVGRVDLIFTPPGLHVGAALSALGIAVLGLLLTISRARREAPGSSRRTENGEVNRFRPTVWSKGRS